MKKGVAFFLATLALTPVTYALDCEPGRTETTFYMTVDPVVEHLEPILGMPGTDGEPVDFKRVLVQWVPTVLPERAYGSESFSVKADGTYTSVKFSDGRKRADNPEIRDLAVDIPDVAPVELLPSNFAAGEVNFKTCMPAGRTDGLAHVIYGPEAINIGALGAGFTVKENKDGEYITVIAPNKETTEQMGARFNETGADTFMENISEVTGVDEYDLARVYAENIIQEAIPLVHEYENNRNAKMGNMKNAIVYSDKIILTKAESDAVPYTASGHIPEGVITYFKGNDLSLTAERQLRNLQNYLNDGAGMLEQEVEGYEGRRQVHLLNGDTTLATTASECSGTSRITSEFLEPSTITGKITLYDDGVAIATGEELNKLVTCNGSIYTVVSERPLTGVDVPTTEDLGYVFSDEAQDHSIEGVWIDGEYIPDLDGDGDLDRRKELACGISVPFSLDVSPTGDYDTSVTGNDGDISILGLEGTITTDCDRIGNKNPVIRVTGDVSRDLTLTYQVLEEVVQAQINSYNTNAGNFANTGETIEVVLECDELFTGTANGNEGNYSGGLDWYAMDVNGNVSGTPTGDDCGVGDVPAEHNTQYTLNNGQTTDSIDVLYRVNAAATYNVEVYIHVIDNGAPYSQTTNPSEEIIKRVWDTDNIGLLEGITAYTCNEGAPGGIVDQLDEVISNYNLALSPEQQEEFSGDRTGFGPFVNDSNANGSACDPEETDGQYTNLIELRITKN